MVHFIFFFNLSFDYFIVTLKKAILAFIYNFKRKLFFKLWKFFGFFLCLEKKKLNPRLYMRGRRGSHMGSDPTRSIAVARSHYRARLPLGYRWGLQPWWARRLKCSMPTTNRINPKRVDPNLRMLIAIVEETFALNYFSWLASQYPTIFLPRRTLYGAISKQIQKGL